MNIPTQDLIALAAMAGALAVLIGYAGRFFGWFQRQRQQDLDIAALKGEQCLVVYGVLACLKGLKEQGCNGPVTEAIQRIEKHLNQQAHR
jgi:hypothetical protein